MNEYLKYFLFFLLLMTLRSYVLMIMDKRKAIKGKWRVSEQKLFISAWLFGTIGIWLGMLPPVNHKKSKGSFIWKMVLITVVQVFIAFMVVREWQ